MPARLQYSLRTFLVPTSFILVILMLYLVMAGKISQFPSLPHLPYVVCIPKWNLLERHEAIVCLSHTETLSDSYTSRRA